MTPFAQNATYILSLGVVITDIIIVLLIVVYISLFTKTKNTFIKQLSGVISSRVFLLGFMVSFGGLLGSLFYSNIVGFLPCELCWFQRMFIFPQVIVFGVALFLKNKTHTAGLLLTSFLMSVVGALIATFHSYGQLYNPGVLAACEVGGVSCSKLYFVTFGYVTIPTMSLTIFLLMLMIVLIAHKTSKRLSA